MCQLIFPDYIHQKAMKSYVHSLREYSEGTLNGIGLYEKYENHFELWIQKEKRLHLGIDSDENLVPSTLYLYIKDEEIIGSIQIRHCLNDALLNKGGHIGYSIAPKYRRQGYATKMLNEVLQICREWEIWPVLLTCDEENIASKRTIEKCGGRFENKYGKTLRYWIGEEK